MRELVIFSVSLCCREEWEWLQSLNADQQVAPPTQTQEEFRKQLAQATQKLFNILGRFAL